ncbi:hypothetical protein COY26_05350 [Candidatus Woesearchaeota archaeon CG_4_10_14_0_2_um_filter_33_10]|nr:MAG: hypothetical protein AUJ83_02570 [Candidatus Woesearchaeota archaeon CG1_02_33_12]PIN78315.1 MAG: hypothetical protein COV14_04095 [Candidatus Woesearchaeota archaeon CG10_big_fil_rev_8_21_14_0_10_33_12]PIU72496.1 MAG: hypothetical protein COS79_02620 [Candidatus Woesearchaeota archaeon CG06_land_8_20_14_3_00_33_13]PIZ51951.1 MAG: hypothetical protein COY26_05350 [Candidatus Woesearchaeota archaeon CG_4_10_14_0_2_um_filter_33_10]
MKITIDTKEDSNEDIKKLIKMLSSLIGKEYASEDENKEVPEVSEGTFNMFDSSAEEKKEEDKEEKPFELNEIVTY